MTAAASACCACPHTQPRLRQWLGGPGVEDDGADRELRLQVDQQPVRAVSPNTGLPRRPVAIDETVILLTLSLSITIDTPTKGRGVVQQNDSLVDGWPTLREPAAPPQTAVLAASVLKKPETAGVVVIEQPAGRVGSAPTVTRTPRPPAEPTAGGETAVHKAKRLMSPPCTGGEIELRAAPAEEPGREPGERVLGRGSAGACGSHASSQRQRQAALSTTPRFRRAGGSTRQTGREASRGCPGRLADRDFHSVGNLRAV